jgi:hypothetical protein
MPVRYTFSTAPMIDSKTEIGEIERFGTIGRSNPPDPSNKRSLAAKNGAGTKSEMGEGAEGSAARAKQKKSA